MKILKQQGVSLISIYFAIWISNRMFNFQTPGEMGVLLTAAILGLPTLLSYRDTLNHVLSTGFFSLILSATPYLYHSEYFREFLSFSPKTFLIVLAVISILVIIWETGVLIKEGGSWKILISQLFFVGALFYAPQIIP